MWYRPPHLGYDYPRNLCYLVLQELLTMTDLIPTPPIEAKPLTMDKTEVKAELSDRLQSIVDRTNEKEKLFDPAWKDLTPQDYVNDIINRHLEGAVEAMEAEKALRRDMDSIRDAATARRNGIG
jgi:hypothetical protein